MLSLNDPNPVKPHHPGQIEMVGHSGWYSRGWGACTAFVRSIKNTRTQLWQLPSKDKKLSQNKDGSYQG
jgi:hypothetical protein